VSLTLEQKQEIVSEVAGVVAQAKSAVVAEYRGMTVSELTELRSNARKMDVYLRVVKNTLARRAMQGTEFACMDDALVGPLLLALSRVEPGDAPKLMGNFAKGHERLVIKAGAYNGKLLKPADIAALAKLPTRNEAIAILMSLMKAPVGKLVRTLAAVRDARQAA